MPHGTHFNCCLIWRSRSMWRAPGGCSARVEAETLDPKTLPDKPATLKESASSTSQKSNPKRVQKSTRAKLGGKDFALPRKFVLCERPAHKGHSKHLLVDRPPRNKEGIVLKASMWTNSKCLQRHSASPKNGAWGASNHGIKKSRGTNGTTSRTCSF